MKFAQYKLRFLWILALIGLTLHACDNKLDIAADWKEVATIYGALSPTDSIHYVRIQRAYLDEDRGALEFSRIADSLYFDTLEVKLEEYRNGSLSNTYDLWRVDGNLEGQVKDSGIFASDVNYLYRTDAEILASNFFNDYVYRLTVKNPNTGYEASCQTISVGQAEVSAPINTVINQLVINAGDDHSVLVKYQEGKHVRSYDVVMRVNIEEVSVADPSQVIKKSLDWKMATGRETRSLNGYETEAFLVPSKSFFAFMGANLTSDTSIYRRLIDYEFYVYGVTDDLYTFINVNRPSIGIVQKKPEFTNVNNGLGIFATRYINKFYTNGFDQATRRSLQTSENTADLGFVLF